MFCRAGISSWYFGVSTALSFIFSLVRHTWFTKWLRIIFVISETPLGYNFDVLFYFYRFPHWERTRTLILYSTNRVCRCQCFFSMSVEISSLPSVPSHPEVTGKSFLSLIDPLTFTRIRRQQSTDYGRLNCWIIMLISVVHTYAYLFPRPPNSGGFFPFHNTTSRLFLHALLTFYEGQPML